LSLCASDALHLAVAERIGAILAAFDVKLTACARALGLEVPGYSLPLRTPDPLDIAIDRRLEARLRRSK